MSGGFVITALATAWVIYMLITLIVAWRQQDRRRRLQDAVTEEEWRAAAAKLFEWGRLDRRRQDLARFTEEELLAELERRRPFRGEA